MIDYRIIAHPSRKGYVENILSALGRDEDIIVWDDREHGGDAMYTARKAWQLPIPEGCTHRLVFNDDVELCNGFCEIAEQVASRHTEHLVSFFHTEKYPQNERYVLTERLYGAGMMLPAKLISGCWDFIDHLPERCLWCRGEALSILKHDTDCMAVWATDNQIPIINTVPSLVQHLGDISLVGITKKRVSPDYTKTPPVNGW